MNTNNKKNMHLEMLNYANYKYIKYVSQFSPAYRNGSLLYVGDDLFKNKHSIWYTHFLIPYILYYL